MIAGLLQLGACSRDIVEPPVDEDTIEPTSVGTCDEASCNPDPCEGDPCCGDPCCEDPDACCSDDNCFETDTNDTDIEPPPDDPCEPVDCGDGVCVVDDAGQPRCDCPDGYANLGTACLPCAAVGEAHDVDVPTATIAIRVTLDGVVPPANPDESARLWLVGAGGDEVALGDTTAPEVSAEVVPGRYALRYGHVGGDVMPRNTAATVAWIDVDGDIEMVVDLAAVSLSGAFTIDSVPAPASAAENGRLSLRAGEDSVDLGETADGAYQTTVLVGEYSVEYTWLAGEFIVPANPRASLGQVEVSPDVAAQQLDVDVTTVSIAGQVQIDGAPAPESIDENARVSLVGATPEDVVVLGETADGTFERRLVPGTYQVVYEHLAGGAAVPTNTRAVIGEADLGAGVLLTIDVPVTTISGVFTLDGGAPPDLGSDGTVYLSTPDGDWAELGPLSAGSYQARVVDGEYDVVYAATQTDDDAYPRNAGAVLAQVSAEGDGMIDIDVPTVSLSGGITIDGAAPPVMGDGGALLLRDGGTGETFELAAAGAPTFAARVVPGVYEVIWAADEVAIVAPVNPVSVIAEIDVAQDSILDLDVPASALSGSITIDGAAPPADATAELRLEDAEALFPIADVAAAAYGVRLTPGSYVVRYAAPEGDGVPANTNAALSCVAVP